MKKAKFKLLTIVLIGLIGIFPFTSCEKEDNVVPDDKNVEDKDEDEDEENNFTGCRLKTISYYVYQNPYQFSYGADGKLKTAFQNLPVTYTEGKITMIGHADNNNYTFTYGSNGLVETASYEEKNYRRTDWGFTYDVSGKITVVSQKMNNYGDNSEEETLYTITYSGDNVSKIAQDFPPTNSSTNNFYFSNYDDGLSLGNQLTKIFDSQPAFTIVYGGTQFLYHSGMLSKNNPGTITGPNFYFNNGEMTIRYEYDTNGNVIKATSTYGEYASFDATYECN